MLDIIFDIIDIFLNLIIDDTVDKATNRKEKKNIRYILFSALCAVLIITFAFLIIYTFITGEYAFTFILFLLFMFVVVSWFRLRYLINRIK